MKDLKNEIFTKFKIKDVFPFYIRNVNALFFANDDQTTKKEIQEHIHNHNFLDKSYVRKVINNMLARIVSITGTQECELIQYNGFDDFGNRMYVKELENQAYAKVLGSKHEDSFFSYQIDFEPRSYLYEMTEGLDLTFHLNHQTKHITGGFAFRNFRFNTKEYYLVSNFYFTNLVNTFLETELFPLSSKNLLAVLKKDENGHIPLRDKWDNLIHSSYQNDAEGVENLDEVKYIKQHKDLLFDEIMILMFLMVFVLEQLDDYFTNKNIHEYLHENFKRTVYDESPDQTCAQDLVALYNDLKKHDAESYEVVKNKKIYKYDNYTLSSPIDFYEIMLKDNVIFLDPQTFIKNKTISSLLSILLFPKSFGLGSANLFQMNYSLLTDLVDENLNSTDLNFMDEDKEQEILNSICEMNFDYVSMMRNGRVVILENNHASTTEIVDEISYYYFWAEIYLQSKIVELRDIENYVNYFFRSNEKWKLITFRKIIRDLHDLDFNENDHFYGIPKIRGIVNHIGQKHEYRQSLEALLLKVKNEDEIYKRQTERMSIIISFMVALMIGYIDFFACIYSVAPCSFSNIDWGWILSSVITGTVFAFVNLCILVTTLVYLLLSRGKMKEIENRRDSNLYFSYNIAAIRKEDEKIIDPMKKINKKKLEN